MRIAARIILLLSIITNALAIQWLSLSEAGYSWDRASHCVHAKNQKLMYDSQTKLCKQNLDLMNTTAMAATEVMHLCQDVFSTNRWNCSSVTAAPNFMPDLTRGTREQAFVYALASAGLVRALARACSNDQLTNCGCGNVPKTPSPGNFKWGGCSDNIPFGMNFGRKFADKTSEKKSENDKILALVNKHNSRVGRRILKHSQKRECKCVGPLGSCEDKLCWKIARPLHNIGDLLKSRYNRAIQVEMSAKGSKIMLRPVNRQTPTFNKDELIYVALSPDYCEKDVKMGSVGTHGRTCNATSTDTDNCDSMCCGRGYTTSKRIHVYQCHCKYHNCCRVTCQTCQKEVEYNVCK